MRRSNKIYQDEYCAPNLYRVQFGIVKFSSWKSELRSLKKMLDRFFEKDAKKISKKPKSVLCPLQKNQTVYNGSDVGTVTNVTRVPNDSEAFNPRVPKWDVEIFWQCDLSGWYEGYIGSAHDIKKMLKHFSKKGR